MYIIKNIVTNNIIKSSGKAKLFDEIEVAEVEAAELGPLFKAVPLLPIICEKIIGKLETLEPIATGSQNEILSGRMIGYKKYQLEGYSVVHWYDCTSDWYDILGDNAEVEYYPTTGIAHNERNDWNEVPEVLLTEWEECI